MPSRSVLEWKRNRSGYFYIAPWVAGFLAFGLIPIVSSFIISLHSWDPLDFLAEWEFVGFRNFADLFTDDPLFARSIGNNLLYMVFANGGGIALSLFMAALLNEKIKGRHAFRVIFFLPSLVVPIAFGLLMTPIFMYEDSGLINWVITRLGGEPVLFLGDPNRSIWVVIITNYWFIGASTVIFLAGIANLPKSYFEAAEIDGAGWWKRFFHITLPLMSPVIFFQVVNGLIGGLRIFDIPAALANIGGNTTVNMGRDNSLATMVFYLYTKGVRNGEFGYASAIGWVIFAIGLLLTVVIIAYLRRNRAQDGAGVEEV